MFPIDRLLESNNQNRDTHAQSPDDFALRMEVGVFAFLTRKAFFHFFFGEFFRSQKLISSYGPLLLYYVIDRPNRAQCVILDIFPFPSYG